MSMAKLSPSGIWNSLGTARFRTNFKWVALANLGAQALLVLASPILTRLFGPADFGVLALYVSLTSIIVSMATLRFDWLMPNARTDRHAAGLFAAGAIVLATVVLAVAFASIAVGDALFAERYEAFRDLWFLIPLGVLGLGLHQLFNGWYVRRSNLLPDSKTKIVQSVGNIAVSIALGVLAFGAMGLLFATLIASWLGITILTANAPDLLRHLRRLRRNELFVSARRYLNQALLSTMVSGFNVASNRAMILLLAFAYAPAEVGLLALAQRLIAAPVALVAQALSQSFWAHASDLVLENDYVGLRRDFLRVTALLVGLAALLGMIALAVQPLIVPLFGAEWADLGLILLVLMPLIWGTTIFSPTNHLVVLKRQELQLYADILRLGLVCGTILVAAKCGWDFASAVFAVACSSLLGHVLLFLLQLHVQNRLIGNQRAANGEKSV